MKRIILIFFLVFNSFINLYAQWARTYGGSDNERGWSIQQTKDGGYIIAGDTYSFGAGGCDIWVIKLSSNGNIKWQKTYGGANYDSGHSIQQTSDGGYVVTGGTSSFGAGNSDIWVIKLSSNGDIEWQKTYGVSYYSSGHFIQQTSDGGYILIGDTWSFGGQSGDILVLKLSSTGDIEWQRAYGEYRDDIGHSIQQTSDGGYILIGDTELFGAGGYDIWVLKLSSNGDIEWQNTYEVSYYSSGHSIQQTSDGGYILIGDTWFLGAQNADICVLKLSSNGEIFPSCECVGTSNATVTNSYAHPQDTVIKPQNTNAVPSATNASPQDSDAIVNTICSTQKFILTISASSGGTTDPASGAHNCYEGMKVTVKALPDNGYRFSEWSGDVSGTDNPLTVVMNKDKSITANFIRQYILTLSATEGGKINPVPGAHAYDAGTSVKIEATPDTGVRFGGWSGDIPQGSENINPLMIAMDSDRSIKANFIRQYKLTLTAGKGGTTEPAPGTYTYDSGTEVTITAKPGSSFKFSGWSIDASGSDNPIKVIMDKDKWIAAAFAAIGEEAKSSSWELKCFIATAAYGSPLHPHVKILRNFRDRYLMPRKLGRMLVRIYYRHSLSIANIITKYRALKLLVRISLLPMIAFSYSMLHFSPIVIGIIFTFIFSLTIFIVCFHRRRRLLSDG